MIAALKGQPIGKDQLTSRPGSFDDPLFSQGVNSTARKSETGSFYEGEEDESTDSKQLSGKRSRGSKKKRRTKKESGNRGHLCPLCNRSYLSYPALYTHKRNKHNIIPINGKQEIFNMVQEKARNIDKFNYSAIEDTVNNYTETIKYIIIQYKKKFDALIKNEKSSVYNPEANLNKNYIYNFLLKVLETNPTSIETPKHTTQPCIDHILVVYLIHFCKVTNVDLLIDLAITFVILLREYLNVVGWDYRAKFFMNGVKVTYNRIGEYTSYCSSEDIPDHINDFLSVFIEMDENKFGLLEKELLDITQNFCNWLFVNNFTNFKIIPNELP